MSLVNLFICSYNLIMKIEFDQNKSNKNRIERNLPFDKVTDFDWESALYSEDIRKSYTEKRIVALGYIKNRLHVICFSEIKEGIRIISFRKANKREVKRYEEEIVNKEIGNQ